MSRPPKSPAPKSTQPTKKKRSSSSSTTILDGLPGLEKVTNNKRGKPVVVVVVKGGRNSPNLENILGAAGKKKKKKGTKKKKSAGSRAKSVTKRSASTPSKTEEEDDESESDRMKAPELPKVKMQKPPVPKPVPDTSATISVQTSSIQSNSVTAAVSTRAEPSVTAKIEPLPSDGKPLAPILNGVVEQPCIPLFVCIDGPVGSSLIVPLDARDESGTVPDGGPQPLRCAPSEDTPGYMIVEDGLLHFKPLSQFPDPPPNTTMGTLKKFLDNSNIFIAKSGAKLPAETTVFGMNPKDKIGLSLAVSGHITITSKGACKFTRVMPTREAPFYPENAAMGVLIKDPATGYIFWVPTENRFVGPLLSKKLKIPAKKPVEMAVVGNIYKDATGALVCEGPSSKLENLIGFILSSATGVPIFAPKPDNFCFDALSVRQKRFIPAAAPPAPSSTMTAPLPSPSSTITAPVLSPAAAVDAAPSPPTLAAVVPPSAEVTATSPLKTAIPRSPISAPSTSPAPLSSTSPKPKPPSPPNSSVSVKPELGAAPSLTSANATSPSSPPPPADNGPSFGWTLLSSLGSVLSTTASVVGSTAAAVSEYTTAAAAAAPSSDPPASAPAKSPSAKSATPVTSATPATPPPAAVVKSLRKTPTTPTKSPKESTMGTQSPTVQPSPSKQVAVAVAAPAPKSDKPSTPGAAAAAASPAAQQKNMPPVVVNIRVTTNGADKNYKDVISDQLSDNSSEGGIYIGEQMESIYKNLLRSQTELPDDDLSISRDERDEESRNAEERSRDEKKRKEEELSRDEERSRDEKKKRKVKEEELSRDEESRRKDDDPSRDDDRKKRSENAKEYKKYMDDRSAYISPYGFR